MGRVGGQGLLGRELIGLVETGLVEKMWAICSDTPSKGHLGSDQACNAHGMVYEG
jgi:hypothetical protein